MDATILQYQISDWHQLRECCSNNSPELHIKVSDFIQNKDIRGTKVEVYHRLYGTLFAYTILPKGDLITEIECDVTEIMRSQTLLNELRRYGFYIDYVDEENLSSGQVELLRTIQGLHYDKIRLLSVHENNDLDVSTNYIVAFNISENEQWLNAGYSPSRREFEKAIVNGSAFNVSGLEYGKHYNWSWIYNAVYDIDDLLMRYEDDEE